MVIGQHGWWNCPTLSGYKVNFVPLDNRRLAGSPRILIGGVLSDDERLTFRCPVRVVNRFLGHSSLLADNVGTVIWRVSEA